MGRECDDIGSDSKQPRHPIVMNPVALDTFFERTVASSKTITELWLEAYQVLHPDWRQHRGGLPSPCEFTNAVFFVRITYANSVYRQNVMREEREDQQPTPAALQPSSPYYRVRRLSTQMSFSTPTDYASAESHTSLNTPCPQRTDISSDHMLEPPATSSMPWEDNSCERSLEQGMTPRSRPAEATIDPGVLNIANAGFLNAQDSQEIDLMDVEEGTETAAASMSLPSPWQFVPPDRSNESIREQGSWLDVPNDHVAEPSNDLCSNRAPHPQVACAEEYHQTLFLEKTRTFHGERGNAGQALGLRSLPAKGERLHANMQAQSFTFFWSSA